MLDEGQLRLAIADALLASAGLPTREQTLKLLSSMKNTVEVVVEVRKKGSKAGNIVLRLKKLLEDTKAKIIPVAVEEWKPGMPEPGIVVGGQLRGRFRFYGDPNDILEVPFLLAVALAGGGWEVSCDNIPKVEGETLVYVVPGLPCVRALYHSLPIVYCNESARIVAVNVETMVVQGMKPPVTRVPAWLTPSGNLHVFAPRTPREAARMWYR